jgi:hypothetical protein
VPEFLRFDARCGKLHLKEAELDGRFLLIVGTKLDLRGRCRCDNLTIASFRRVVRENKTGGSPSNFRGLFPGRKKERGSLCEKLKKENQMAHKSKTNKNGVLH